MNILGFAEPYRERFDNLIVVLHIPLADIYPIKVALFDCRYWINIIRNLNNYKISGLVSPIFKIALF